VTGHVGEVKSLVATPDGARIVSGRVDHTVREWRIASGELERTLDGPVDSAKRSRQRWRAARLNF